MQVLAWSTHVPPESPHVTPENVMALQAFAKEKIRLEGEETT